ncbi:protamine-like protein [Cololabis saira]|uniref:protamine-like protein n=1 Tax=Cololabis saira TaxID=129043 RepID=UPI002AD2397B|nr:protamine-like protein [Cololabis saira]
MSSPSSSPLKRKRKTGPTVSARILKAVSASSQRGGVSLVALKKVLKAGGYDVVKNKVRIRTAIKRLVTKKSLVQSKGSYKINKKAPAARKKKVVKRKKPKTKKKTAVKKKAVKKSPKKKRKAKSPKKAKKAAGPKKTKKPKSKSPKKPKRKAAKRARPAKK